MLENKTSVVDDRGYNQGFKETPALIKRMERRGEWIISKMDTTSGKRLLEIGCGTGFLSYYIASKTSNRVIGSDLCLPFIESAKQRFVLPNLEYDVLDFNKADDMDERFDYIVGNGILHHLYYNLDSVLSTFNRLLPRGGSIIFMEPNIYNPYVASIFKIPFLRKWARLEPDEMAFSKTFITEKLVAAEFVNVEVRYKDFLLPGIPRWLIKPSIAIGNVLEKTPLKYISQSILISAKKATSN